ncbi:hypothetical protein FQA39_LY11696 [Lamprigera yunnana]|nr:hypothetical protein FQA39_LY11696 [Lamprigera yunnana]
MSSKHESWDVDETRYFLKLIRQKQIFKSLDVNNKLEDDNVTVEEGEQPPQPKRQRKSGKKSYQHTFDQFAETSKNEVNEVNDLDENSRVLFKLIEAKFNGWKLKFNGLDSKIDNTLITVKEKLCELDDRVLKLEDNNVYLLENVISEINKRNSKECNCIIYKLEDSENAVKKDIELFKNLLACCNDEPSFNINDIKLIRLGKKFKSGVDRPLKVVFPNKDCLHWFFHNKKMIIEKSKKSIIITGDLTNAQRDFRNKVLSEIKLRREKVKTIYL